MDDRNKSELHNKIQDQVYLWMLNSGFKPVEQEVGIGGGWIVDLAGIIQPTPTECQRLKLVERAPKNKIEYEFDENKQLTEECRKKLDDFSIAMRSWRDKVYQFRTLTAICEVKVSMSDYKKDIKRKFSTTRASINFLAYPKGMLSKEEIPENWFGLECISDDRIKYYPGKLIEQTKEQMFDIMYEICMRIYNKNLYSKFSEIEKENRINRIEPENHYKIQKILYFFIDFLEHPDLDIDEHLRMNRIKVRDYYREKITKLVKDYHEGNFKKTIDKNQDIV